MHPVDDPSSWQVVGRLAAAAAAGLLLGLNREMKGKPAGLRTHALVSLGGALLALTALHIPSPTEGDALSRVIQGVITGIGFLGAGVIIQQRSGHVVGLTTAATIWVSAALGLACGAGYWVAVVTTTLLIFVVLLLEGVERRFRPYLDRNAPEASEPGGEDAARLADEGGEPRRADDPSARIRNGGA